MYLYPNLGETAFSIWPVRKMTVPANKGPVGWNTKPFEEKKNEKKKVDLHYATIRFILISFLNEQTL